MSRNLIIIAICVASIVQLSECVSCDALGGRCISLCMGNGGTFDCSNGAIVNKGCPGDQRCCVEVRSPLTTTTVATTTVKDNSTLAPGLTDNCVECIGVASGGRGSTGCNPLCGPFGLKWRYWSDCDKPGKAYWSCIIDYDCAKLCTETYLKKNSLNDVAHDNCEFYARLHNGRKANIGNDAKTNRFWNKVNTCCLGKTDGC